jgi:hypothetical protein
MSPGGQTGDHLAEGRAQPGHTTVYLPDGTELRVQRPCGPVTGTRYDTHTGHTIALRRGPAVTWLANDHHGTASFAVDPTSLAVTRRRTLPFGTPVAWPGERGFVGATRTQWSEHAHQSRVPGSDQPGKVKTVGRASMLQMAAPRRTCSSNRLGGSASPLSVVLEYSQLPSWPRHP